MSKYTTGEIAKLCDVSVRTVQYYDARGILVPSELSDGGRRLYSGRDLNKMKIICFLRGMEIPIDSIKKLFAEEHPEKVISILLDEQERLLKDEITEKQERAERISEARKTLRLIPDFSVESIYDVANIMEKKKDLRRLRTVMLIFGFASDAIQVSTLMLWILRGTPWPFIIGAVISVAISVYISALYYRNTAFICPECHSVFKHRFKEMFFARHTPYTRKLTCPLCSHHGFCVETYRKDDTNA